MNYYKTTPLVEIIKSDNGDCLRLKRTMTYFFGDKTIVVPRGFECDGASVPRILWGTISPTIHPQTIAGAILHDYLYRTQPEDITRQEADAIFYAVCRADGLPFWRAGLAWIGLRLFGGRAWKQKKKEGVRY